VEDLKRTIAVLFRRKGKGSITEKEFVFSASIDLRWFSPKAAQRLLDIALQLNLISRRNGELIPNFNIEDIHVPLEFKPTEDILDTQEEDTLSRIISKLSESKLERRDLVARINALQKRFGIDIEIAALMLGNDLGIDMKELISIVEEKVKKEAKSNKG